MKKALISLSLLASGIMLASATVGGTIVIGVGNTQGAVNGSAILGLLALAQTFVSRFSIFAVGLAVVAFFWFLIEWIWKGREDATAKTNSIKGMGYSILALFVMVSIWGIVGFLGSVTGINQGGNVPIPTVPVPAA